MKLKQLLERMDYRLVQGDPEKEITGVAYDSRVVDKGNLFVCIPGTVTDGHDYIPMALSHGAAAFVVTREVTVPAEAAVIRVDDAREALALCSAAWFGYPAEKLTTIGITGTKGKTTTAYMVYQMLCGAGIRTGLIGTVENIIGEEHLPASHSTPESYLVQKYFAQMVERGCKAVVMEVSSQGLKMKRVAGFVYDIGLFTNLEPDHIGPREHESFEEYMRCKGLLFRQCRLGLVNGDDAHAESVLQGHTCEVRTFGVKEGSDYRAEQVNLHSASGSMGVAYQLTGRRSFPVVVNIPGAFSVYNSLAAIGIASELGVPEETVLSCLRTIRVRGRVELVPVSEDYTVMVDYAHNGMALRSLLTTLREYEPGRLICVFGCGGNRSRERRFEMGEISSRLADLTIATSDNPRFEEPQEILNDIITGIQKGPGRYVAIIDRKEAIRYALTHAKRGDCIVIAGKGHEDYQEIKGVKYPMDDREMIRSVAEEMTV